MANWTPLRRARDSIKPHRPVSLCPAILETILDEIQELKKQVKQLKERKRA